MIEELKELKEKIKTSINKQALLLSKAKTNEQASYFKDSIVFDKGQLTMLNHIIYKYEKD